MLGHFGLKDSKRIYQISLERDWSRVSLENSRLFTNHNKRRIGGGWTLKRYNIRDYLSLVLDTFWWIGLFELSIGYLLVD